METRYLRPSNRPREIARLLLERGADPNWPESAPPGRFPARRRPRGDHELVELLLAHGADPNGMWTRRAMPLRSEDSRTAGAAHGAARHARSV